MTTMKPYGKKKNIFYCQHCKTQYKQHINGKIVYIPLHVADLLEQTIKDHYKNSNRPIIIFPQATRVDINDRSPFKKGVKRIYSELNIICQPVALNSGLVWPKKGKMKHNKTRKIN